jgi:TolB-like protein
VRFKPVLLILFFACLLILPTLSFAQSQETDKVYKVAILPFIIRSQENLDYLREGIYDILTSRVSVEEMIEVVKRSVVERALYEEKPMRLDEAMVTKIGMRVGADFVVFGSITKIGEDISLDARLISTSGEKPPLTVYADQKGIDGVMMKIGDFARDIRNKILGPRAETARQDKPNGPYIVKSFTVKKIKYGDILKIYLEAEDPDGEMVRIGTEVDQTGYGRYPISWVSIKPADRKRFKGYLQWNTFSSKASILSDGTSLTLSVFVSDKAGNKSKPVVFPITFESGVKSASSFPLPPPFDQKDAKRLGYIDVELMDLTIWDK